MPNDARASHLSRCVYGLTIFVGSYLLFQIQPLVGKIVTARFGGAAGIWCVCMLFFQLALLGGYTLTYLLSKLPVRWQCLAYAVLMIGSVVVLNVPPAAGWIPEPNADPVRNLLVLLSIHLAVPCILMSTVSGMIQNWFAIARLGNPYPLYSLSNIGSMGALLAYPFIVEPRLTVSHTVSLWTAGYGLLAFLTCLSSLLMLRLLPQETTPEEQLQAHAEAVGVISSRAESAADSSDASHTPVQASMPVSDFGEASAIAHSSMSERPSSLSLAPPGTGDFAWWIGLSALSSTILLTYTTFITQDIAPVPLLWILPLCLYLLTFILCFGDKNLYSRTLFLYGGPMLWFVEPFLHEKLLLELACVLLTIFFFCMSCNGEIVRRKPDPVHLPAFYLAIAIGGALGGIFVNLLAPQIFSFYLERSLIVVCMVGLCLYVSLKEGAVLLGHRWVDNAYLVVITYACVFLSGYKCYSTITTSVDRARNLYGCISVAQGPDDSMLLASGTIVHGSQYMTKGKRREPTQYFTRDSAVGFIDYWYRKQHPGIGIKYGVVGLGAGTIAAYGEKGDSTTFYELDPKVLRFANKYFTFLSDSPANVNVLLGDARITMEKQSPQDYDILVIDAFNGDAIPIHLLTRESVELYMRLLKPDGMLLMHVSNRYLDLTPELGNIAQALNLKAYSIRNDHAKYVVMNRDPAFNPQIAPEMASFFARVVIEPCPTQASAGVWTDDYSNLASVLLWRNIGKK